jgi:[ribosomal protein S18]-alanine N-acetyltransferase
MSDPEPYAIARVIDPEDLDEVAALEAASFTNPWTRDMLARELSHSDVARVYGLRGPDGRLLAFCACWIVFEELHINTLAVAADRRRQGLATRLLDHVFTEAVAAGVRRATLEVRRSNEPALRLYERLGFTVTAVRRGYYSQPVEDGLVLWHDDLAGRSPRAHP